MSVLQLRAFAFSLLLATFTVIPHGASAQLRPSIGMHGSVQLPVGELPGSNRRGGLGLGARGGLGYAPVPLQVGLQLDLAWLVGTGEEVVRPLMEVPGVVQRATAASKILMTHGWLRAQPWSGAVRPFAEGLLGFKMLFTHVQVALETADGDSLVVDADDERESLALSYGFGAGLDIPLGVTRDAKRNTPIEPVITLGVQLLWGGEADHFEPGSGRYERRRYVFDTSRAPTDLVMIYVGLNFVTGKPS
jgi:hypothetical protein